MIRPVQAQQGAAGATPQAAPVPPTREQLRETIRQSIQAAQDAAEDAAHAGNPKVTVGRNGIVVRTTDPATGEPTVYVNPRGMDNVIPPQAVDIAMGFFIMCAVMVIGWPLARAFGRRLERRGQVTTLDPGPASQLLRIEQAVEAMAIEIERISESQRFMAKLQSDSTDRAHALPVTERR